MNKATYLEEYPKHQSMRENVKKDKNRLHFHIIPPTGWINDPNGLCQFQGTYHIYFQYTPFVAGWGTKIWGHYTTNDWIHFQEEEPFLFPDCDWDRDGVYSGSAFIKEDEIHYFYTGNVKYWDQDYDYIMNGRAQNTIHVMSRDGKTASEKQLIMQNQDYPSDMSKHVRDPKIYPKNGKYYMVQGARDANSKGCVLVFESEDLMDWKYICRIQPNESFGYLWECPDLFDLDGQTILIACPQGISQSGYRYQNIYQCGYFPIQLDLEKKEYILGQFEELDKGFDFYAAQTFEDQKGRRILIAWMAVPDSDYRYDTTAAYDWIHTLTMPRVLQFQNGKLIQQPLEEMKALRKTTRKSNISDFGTWNPKDCCFEMQVQIDKEPENLMLQLRDDVTISYQDQVITLSLGKSGCGRKTRMAEVAMLKEFTIFSDTSSLEIFINNGETVMTTRVYSDDLNQTVSFLTPEISGTVIAYELDSYVINWENWLQN
ncbi:MAG: glycoside hydrolase family 32 protein [Candidatus Fimimorpha sp.]